MAPSRRELLGGVGSVPFLGSGCLSDLSTDTYGIESPSRRECAATPGPTPTPTDDLHPKPYPDPPRELSARRATRFAIEYERVYQHNWVVSTEWLAGTNEVDVIGVEAPERARRTYKSGFIVLVEGELKTGGGRPPETDEDQSGSPTSVPYLDSVFSTWYYVNPDFGLRDERDSDETRNTTPAPTFSDAEVIYCRG